MNSQRSNVIPFWNDISINPIQHKSKGLGKSIDIDTLICTVDMIEHWCLGLQEEEESGISVFYPRKRSDIFIKLNKAIAYLYKKLESM